MLDFLDSHLSHGWLKHVLPKRLTRYICDARDAQLLGWTVEQVREHDAYASRSNDRT